MHGKEKDCVKPVQLRSMAHTAYKFNVYDKSLEKISCQKNMSTDIVMARRQVTRQPQKEI